jgi:hypothetical protein
MKPVALTLGDRLDAGTALRLTLLTLVLRPPGPGWQRGLMWLAAGLALVVPSLAAAPALWWGLTAACVARVVLAWPLADNHLYLLAYWSLAVALALGSGAPVQTLARAARWLVGCTFLCAVLWKGLLAPDFLDARFFRVTLLTDLRFEELTRAVGRLSTDELQESREALEPLPAGAEYLDGPVVRESASLRATALALTWMGFVLEALLAAAFLLPRPAWLVRLRHPLLIAFCAVTYAIAPVAGFGWLLASMGLAQCEAGHRRTRIAYVAVCALLFVYAETPLLKVLLRAAAP